MVNRRQAVAEGQGHVIEMSHIFRATLHFLHFKSSTFQVDQRTAWANTPISIITTL